MIPPRDRGPVEALADARDQPDGPARQAALERLATRADAQGDARTALAARLALIETHLHHGEWWRLPDLVRRCLTAVDRAPGLLGDAPADAGTLRRYQRYAIEGAFGSPRAGLDAARSLLDDLARRSEPDSALVAELRCRLADHLGDEPTARREYARWRRHRSGAARLPTDPNRAAGEPAGGCPACGLVRQAQLVAGWGDPAGALDTLRPVLDGELSCTDQPEQALAVGLLPWLRAGAADQAARAHVRAYRRHRRERAGLPHLAAHLRFCALGGHLERGLDILAEQLPRLADSPDDLVAMEFAAAGALLCGLAVEAGLGGRPVPGAGARRGVDVATLGAELAARATRLAGSFDARNGTGHQSGRIAAWLAARPLAAPVPLPAENPAGDLRPDEEPDEPAGVTPLSLAMIGAALDRRGDDWTSDGGTVTGRWGAATIRFRPAGPGGEVLHARVVADRRLAAARRAEAYAFCNAWNHDRLLPKAYVHEHDGELVLAGDVTVDLAYGVAPAQLAVLLTAAVTTGTGYAEAVAALP
ncbi:YbjN domain-containing protein [Micromonospora sp. PLK6-60]|uniref:YbjN domain-containing protein n=1 Tax=Micromonospora sp. PLK6-60 TaxID=2873383 RepID=UPI001CA6FA0F|nr:YbjN domain-containing protein [Micromonospora sp. PLK6-60]MBY8871071.1 YbjN domain-containing protein [Micromonospora sp. PLK6-60]